MSLNFPDIPNKLFGDKNFNLNVTSTNSIDPIKYTSSSESVALVNSIGEVSVLKFGTIAITASQGTESITKTLTILNPQLCGNQNFDTCNFTQNNFKISLSGDSNSSNTFLTKHKVILSQKFGNTYIPIKENKYINYGEDNSITGFFYPGDYKTDVKTIYIDPIVFPCCPNVGVEVLNLIDYSYSNKNALCVFKNNFLSFVSGFLSGNLLNKMSNIYFSDNPFYISGQNLTRNTGDLILDMIKIFPKEKEYERSCLNEAVDYITGTKNTMDENGNITQSIPYINWTNESLKVINIITNNLPLVETFHNPEDDCKMLDKYYTPAVGIEITGFYQKIKNIKEALNEGGSKKAFFNFIYADKNLNLNLNESESFLEEEHGILFYQKAAQFADGNFIRNAISPVFESINTVSKFTSANNTSDSNTIPIPISSSSSSVEYPFDADVEVPN
jgi:hypothetical protein